MSPPAELTYRVPEDADGERLDRWLAEALPQYSREYLQSLIKDGCVGVDSKATRKPATILKAEQDVTLTVPEPKPLVLPAWDTPLDVVYEDNDLVVLNKPHGMLTHPTGRRQEDTLVNALLHHCRGQLSGINGVERPGIVHRLDRDTSGLLMVAKTDAAHRDLQAQLQARTAKRQYRALVQGLLPAPTGTVDAPIGRNPKKRDTMAVAADGREARTHWTVEATYGDKISVVQLNLETGRTHQIRVHMAHLGHPIFGDPVYGTGLDQQLRFNAHGQILQAFRLAFTHPTRGEALQFEIAPDERFRRAQEFLENWAS